MKERVGGLVSWVGRNEDAKELLGSIVILAAGLLLVGASIAGVYLVCSWFGWISPSTTHVYAHCEPFVTMAGNVPIQEWSCHD